MGIRNVIIDDIWAEQLVWYGYVQRIDEERLPERILNSISTGRRKKKRETKNKMERRRTQSVGRKWPTSWRLGCQTSLEIGCRKTLPYIIERLHT
jgi:hypothetical protein